MTRYHLLRQQGQGQFILQTYTQEGHVGPTLERELFSRSLGYLRGLLPKRRRLISVDVNNLIEAFEEVGHGGDSHSQAVPPQAQSEGVHYLAG